MVIVKDKWEALEKWEELVEFPVRTESKFFDVIRLLDYREPFFVEQFAWKTSIPMMPLAHLADKSQRILTKTHTLLNVLEEALMVMPGRHKWEYKDNPLKGMLTAVGITEAQMRGWQKRIDKNLRMKPEVPLHVIYCFIASLFGVNEAPLKMYALDIKPKPCPCEVPRVHLSSSELASLAKKLEAIKDFDSSKRKKSQDMHGGAEVRNALAHYFPEYRILIEILQKLYPDFDGFFHLHIKAPTGLGRKQAVEYVLKTKTGRATPRPDPELPKGYRDLTKSFIRFARK